MSFENNDDNDEDENYIPVKAILIGDDVGKTSLIKVSIGMQFNPNEKPTVSSTFVQKKMIIDSKEYCINLWDTAGREKLKSLAKLFFKGSQVVIFAYDITDKNSFIGLKKWVEEVENILENKYVCGIVGNKQDLYSQEQVKEDEVMEYAESKGMKFKLVSAKDNPKGFNDFLEELVKDGINIFEKKRKISLVKKKKKKLNCNC